MRDDLGTLIESLRVKGHDLPGGFAAAPILDDWEFRVTADVATPLASRIALMLIGRISAGDNRFSPGKVIFTSPVAQIDGRASIRWARTRNTLYRLGAPALSCPLTAAVALAQDWMDALTLLALATGEHTLDGAALATYTKLLNVATSQDWSERRLLARAISAAMDHGARFSLRDAWALLGADPREQTSAQIVRDLLVGSISSIDGAQEDAIPVAWEAFASGNFLLLGDEQDHIAGARAVGERLTRESRAPLFVRVALQRNWSAAWKLAAHELPKRLVNEAVSRGIEGPDDLERLRIARALAGLRGWDGDGSEPYIMRLLACSPADIRDVDWVVRRLEEFPAGGDVVRARRLWQALADCAAAEETPTFELDAFASAWAASGRQASRDICDEPEVDLPPPPPQPPGVVVLLRIGGTTKSSSGKEVEQEFKSIVGRRLQLAVAPDLARARATLVDEFPHLVGQIDVLLTGLVPGKPARMPPTLLVGEPGGGKSRLARRLAEELRVPLHRFDGSGSSDNAFGGTPRRWSSGEHCVPLEAVRRGMVANPIVLVDEIDKAGSSRHNGSLDRALLPFLEPENARAYPDPYIQSECDLSHVNYTLTANDAAVLPAPFRDRLRIVVLPQPGIEHLPQLARSIIADVAKSRGGDVRWWPALEDYELAIAETLWCGGSLRRLRAVIERLLAYREANPRN